MEMWKMSKVIRKSKRIETSQIRIPFLLVVPTLFNIYGSEEEKEICDIIHGNFKIEYRWEIIDSHTFDIGYRNNYSDRLVCQLPALKNNLSLRFSIKILLTPLNDNPKINV
jgi:hypothetical protein